MIEESWQDFAPHVLREYALIADGERGALCGPLGDLAWLCAPGWADDAVLSGLIGGAGTYSVSPTEASVWGGYYEPGTLIWRNRWTTTDTVLECREGMALPADEHRAVILRRIEAIEDEVRVRVQLDIRGGFGRRGMRELHRNADGRWTARTGNLRLRWSGGRDATVDEHGRLSATLVVPAGGHHDLVLEISDRTLPDPVDPARAWADTEQGWRDRVPTFDNTVAPRDARHAYAVLRGLTTTSGGMVAAATLGLPERAEAGRNYDYRYVWLRDQCYAGLAVAADAPHPLLDDAVRFCTARILADGDRIAPAYRPDGADLPEETTLALPGYPGGRDIVGNRVADQFQLDALGEILQLFAAAARHDRLDKDAYRAMELTVDLVAQRWDKPDAGVWELHDDWWTQSRLACVAGLRAVAAALPPRAGGDMATLAEAILAETSRRCVDPSGGWRRCPDLPGVDAALLLPPVRGAVPATDPRTRATLAAVRSDLTEDGYVYRFAHGDEPLGRAEGAFLLCGFTMALATWQQGDDVDAFRWFERSRAACGPSGLFAEEYDVRQRQLRGNLPQAFVHAALLETAQRLAVAPGNA
jgi:GH15 family glucan-1,4-alpha-glucosidase